MTFTYPPTPAVDQTDDYHGTLVQVRCRIASRAGRRCPNPDPHSDQSRTWNGDAHRAPDRGGGGCMGVFGRGVGDGGDKVKRRRAEWEINE